MMNYTALVSRLLVVVFAIQTLAIVQCAVAHRPQKDCDVPCKGGSCTFKNCNNPTCRGGDCYFFKCKNPSCDGGKCIFEKCSGATCKGGGCDFIAPLDTLGKTYCSGSRCTLEGKPWPNFAHYLTV